MIKGMKRELSKIFGASQDATPAAENVAQQEEVTSMTVKEGHAALSANVEQVATLVAQLASANETLVASQSQFAELTAKFEAAQTQLADIAAAKAALEVEAKQAKLTARKEKVEASIGTANAAAVLAATEGLEDAQFEAIVGAMAKSFETEASSNMFTETGVAAEAAVVEDADPVKSLAAKVAAKFQPK